MAKTKSDFSQIALAVVQKATGVESFKTEKGSDMRLALASMKRVRSNKKRAKQKK